MSRDIKLKDIAIKIGSGATPSGGQNSYHSEGIALIRSQNVLDYKFSINGLVYIDETQAKELNNVTVEENDILLNITGDSIARVCLVPNYILPARVNQHVAIIRCNQTVESKFVFYYLINLKPYLLKICGVGGTRNALTKEAIEKLEISLPDLPTQQKISSVLSSLDDKIELNNKINAELEAMAKTLYDYWFVQFDFPDADGKPYKTNGGTMVWNEELKREIPDGWEVGNLSDIGEIIGGSTPSKDIEEYFSTHGTAWITPKDLSQNGENKFITRGEIDVSLSGLKAASLKIMPKNTVLLSSRAPIGYMAISRESVTTNQGFKSFVPKNFYSTPFIYYTIKRSLPEIINNASGSTFKEISAGTLKIIKVCLSKEDVIKNFTSIINPIFARQNKLEIENQTLDTLRDWLLPMLMNGQVVVA